jgi:excisionase family DNA binding protein
MEVINLHELPAWVKIEVTIGDLDRYVDKVVERILQTKNAFATKEEAYINIDGAMKVLNLARSTVYRLVEENEIPAYKTGRKLRFLASELNTWVATGKRKTTASIEAEADKYIYNKRKK